MSSGEPAPLVLLGATGFVGRHLLHLLAAAPGGRRVTIITRPASSKVPIPLPEGWSVAAWDMAGTAPLDPATIPPGAVVLNLAAPDRRASRSVMRATIVDGTRRVAECARAAGASHLIQVSSIAAGFRNRRWYAYANAKLEAEAVAARSGVPVSIVRPTMVFGSGSPVQEGLERLATGPAPIVLGGGLVELQPIDVEDLARLLLALTSHPPLGAAILTAGGPERCTVRSLLARMRRAKGLPPRRTFSIPLGVPRLLLAGAEAVLGPRLPVTAGQLASFLNDSVAEPGGIASRLLPHPRSLAEMLQPALPPEPPVDQAAAREFAVFSRYLGNPGPTLVGTEAYARGLPLAAAADGDRLDQWLVRLASGSRVGCALADSYARLVRPYGGLRRRLVLALAVLEAMPGVHSRYDSARPSTLLAAWLSLGFHGARWALNTTAAVLLLGPVHLAIRATGQGRRHG